MNEKYRANLMESLVLLYLRLNGFFLTSLIVHSPNVGRNRTEVDALGLRMPFHSQPDTTVQSDSVLDLSEQYIDLLVCEVKGKGQHLQFNRSMRTSQSIDSLLRWSGLLSNSEIHNHRDTVLNALAHPNQPAIVESQSLPGARVRIRRLLFCLERDERRSNQPLFITGSETLGYIQRCLVPNKPRGSCATKYDFSLWKEHEWIVRHFKRLNPDSATTFDEICSDPDVRSRFTGQTLQTTSIESTAS